MKGMKDYFSNSFRKEEVENSKFGKFTGTVIDAASRSLTSALDLLTVDLITDTILNLNSRKDDTELKTNGIRFGNIPLRIDDTHSFEIITEGLAIKKGRKKLPDKITVIGEMVEWNVVTNDIILKIHVSECPDYSAIEGDEILIASQDLYDVDKSVPDDILDNGAFSYETVLNETLDVHRGHGNIFTFDNETYRNVDIIGLRETKLGKNKEYSICFKYNGKLMILPLNDVSMIIYTVDILKPLPSIKSIIKSSKKEEQDDYGLKVGKVYKIKKTNGTKVMGAVVTLNYDSVVLHTNMGTREIPFSSIAKVKEK